MCFDTWIYLIMLWFYLFLSSRTNYFTLILVYRKINVNILLLIWMKRIFWENRLSKFGEILNGIYNLHEEIKLEKIMLCLKSIFPLVLSDSVQTKINIILQIIRNNLKTSFGSQNSLVFNKLNTLSNNIH